MGVFDEIRKIARETISEMNEYGSRGLDVLPKTPESHNFCLKKIKRKMILEFIRPLCFSVIVLIGAAFFRYMRYINDVPLDSDELKGYAIAGAVAGGIALLAYVLFFEGYGKLRRGEYELYGGMCLGRKSGRGYHQVHMNGAYLEVSSQSYDSVSNGNYYFILRVQSKKKVMYFFAYADKSVSGYRTGDIYPRDY